MVSQQKEVEKERKKENSFGMFSLHGCTGKSTTVREKICFLFFWGFFGFFFSSVALLEAEVFQEVQGEGREVNGGLTLWFKQGTRPVSPTKSRGLSAGGAVARARMRMGPRMGRGGWTWEEIGRRGAGEDHHTI